MESDLIKIDLSKARNAATDMFGRSPTPHGALTMKSPMSRTFRLDPIENAINI
jgi:hypothetical protein